MHAIGCFACAGVNHNFKSQIDPANQAAWKKVQRLKRFMKDWTAVSFIVLEKTCTNNV
jgi:hypothetical protein